MKRLTHHIELISNIAIIVVAILLCIAFGKRFFEPAVQTPPPGEIAAGATISIPNVNWSESNKTLILALQKDCHFCTESAPFYRDLTSAAPSKAIRLLAVLPQKESVAREYLKSIDVQIGEVRELPLSSISVRGTPTLILVNGSGTVIKSWVGKLPDAKQKEVLGML